MRKCPKCDSDVDSVVMEQIDAFSSGHPWNAVSYSCPACHCVLGVEFDPLSLKADIVEAVVQALRKDLKS